MMFLHQLVYAVVIDVLGIEVSIAIPKGVAHLWFLDARMSISSRRRGTNISNSSSDSFDYSIVAFYALRRSGLGEKRESEEFFLSFPQHARTWLTDGRKTRLD